MPRKVMYTFGDKGDYFQCDTCQQIKPRKGIGEENYCGGTGYSVDCDTNKLRCYGCGARTQRDYMREHDRKTLYFVKSDTGIWEITDWPGMLKFKVCEFRKFKHPFSRQAYCGSFRGPDNVLWRFKNIGNSQIAHCRKAK